MATRKHLLYKGVLFLFALAIYADTLMAADWSTCADDLDRLRRSSRDAADIANDVKSKYDEFENCRRDPEIYDLLGDRCQSKASDYKGAVSSLENELSTTDSPIRSINASCGIELQTIGTPSAGKENNSSINQICALYRGYIGKLPFETLLKTCRQSMPEAECKQCLLEK